MESSDRCEVLHFMPPSARRGMGALERRVTAPGGRLVYDLEDPHWVPFHDDDTRRNRKAARRILVESRRGSRTLGDRVGIRINAVGSEDYGYDLQALATITSRLSLLVVPKITAVSDIERLEQDLPSASLKVDETVFMFESRVAVDRVLALASALGRAAFGRCRLMFGGNDYCLDAGIDPFWHWSSGELWSVASRIMAAAAEYGFGYVHTMIDSTDAAQGFARVCRRLVQQVARPVAVPTVTMEQNRLARAASGMEIDDSPPVLPPPLCHHEVVSFYHAYRRRGFGFAHDPASGRFVSPHRFLAACRALGRDG